MAASKRASAGRTCQQPGLVASPVDTNGQTTARSSGSRSTLAVAARRIVFRRMDGTMSVTQRDRAIQDFQERADVNVLIVSLKAAALGLNLVAANHVVLLDLVRLPASTQLCCGMFSKDPQGLYCELGAVPGCFCSGLHLTLPSVLSGKGVCLNRGVCTTALGLLDLVRRLTLCAPCVARFADAAQQWALSHMLRPLPVLSWRCCMCTAAVPGCGAPSAVPPVQHGASCLPTPGAAGCAWPGRLPE